jgi:8-hydroxy-5-deazaflavin:NADPH oxidoreductase
VDITNPVNVETWDSLATEPGSSSAEEVQQLLGPGTPVVKAFNTTFAPTLVKGEVDGQPLDVLIAGDDEGAKHTVAGLATDGGLRRSTWARCAVPSNSSSSASSTSRSSSPTT